jgi:hypothetical protein
MRAGSRNLDRQQSLSTFICSYVHAQTFILQNALATTLSLKRPELERLGEQMWLRVARGAACEGESEMRAIGAAR